MADFCKQCSMDVFGEDFGEMANLTTPEQTAKGLFATVICEDCGVVQVDHEGNCITHEKRPQHGYTATGSMPGFGS
jgi:hypothetical protein